MILKFRNIFLKYKPDEYHYLLINISLT